MASKIHPTSDSSCQNYFQFRQFRVCQDRCGMKIGTDAIAFAALVSIKGAKNVFEIGVGTGVVSLILAQRSIADNAQIDGIELDGGAAKQAADNYRASPWSSRLTVENVAFQNYHKSQDRPEFDRIVCNPPFFSGSHPPDTIRNLARHRNSLPLETLFQKSDELLAESGRMAVILPNDQVDDAVAMAQLHSLYLARVVSIVPFPGRQEIRRVLEFSRLRQLPATESLIIRQSHQRYTGDFKKLTEPYYLPRTFKNDPI